MIINFPNSLFLVYNWILTIIDFWRKKKTPVYLYLLISLSNFVKCVKVTGGCVGWNITTKCESRAAPKNQNDRGQMTYSMTKTDCHHSAVSQDS